MLEIDTDGNEKLTAIVEYMNEHDHVSQYWRCTNVVAVKRLGYNDHGEKHVEIVTQKALQMLRLLRGHREPAITTDYDMAFEDAEVVLLLAGLLHDTGHIVHRYNHSEYSLIMANNLIEEILEETGLYTKQDIVVLKAEILHAIQSHHRKANPLTLEAGILRVADALDMEKGRADAAESRRDKSIHAISALSVEQVNVREGEDMPVLIDITLRNSSGVFQLDELAKEKIEGSGLEDVITMQAEVRGEEQNILDTYEL